MISINTAFNIDKEEERNLDWERFLQVMVSHLENGSAPEFDFNGFRSHLEVFLNLPFCLSASLFLINEGTFEFNHLFSCPDLKDDLAQKPFAALVYQGKIAEALNSNQGYLTGPHQGLMNGTHFLIMPGPFQLKPETTSLSPLPLLFNN